LGELLSLGQPTLAAPFMSACIIVTQVVITLSAAWVGKASGTLGRRPLLLVAFGVLPLRAVLYTLTHSPALLIGIQVLDGVANSIFGVVSILVIADRLRHSGRFNLGQGALGTMVGLGAAFSATLGGVVVQRLGFNASFLVLGGVAAVAFAVLYVGVPETRDVEVG
jgi:MFS family permease